MHEAKAVYIFEYYLVCRFVIKTLRLLLKFRVTSLTINSHRGGEILRFHNGRVIKEKIDLSLFSFSPPIRVNRRYSYKAADKIIFGKVNHLRFTEIPSKGLKKTQEHGK